MPDEEASRQLWLEHLERVLILSEQRERELDDEDRLAIAHELGISDEDLARARELAANHLTRGRGYLKASLWDSAIDELRHALGLDPSRNETVLALADAYAHRFAKTGVEEDAAEARRLARFALQREPGNAEGFALLKRLDDGKRRLGHDRRHAIAGITVAIVLLTGAATFALSSDEPAQVAPAETEPDAEPDADPVAPPTRTTSDPAPIRATASDECPAGLIFEPPGGCVVPKIVVQPGVGVAGMVIGESTAEDVLTTYGRDAKVSRHSDGEVFNINYAYDGEGGFDAGRTANLTRPGQFHFRGGRLSKIDFGVYNRAFRTPGGIDTNNSVLDDMVSEFGRHYQLSHGNTLDTYRYENQGIEFYVNPAGDRITSFFVIARSQ